MVFLFWLSVLFVFYTYLGYPVLLAIFARFKGRAGPDPEFYPFVTVLIPAYNEEEFIGRKLENTLALDYPREKFQIIVAADGSSDRTVEIASRYEQQGVEVSYTPERGGKMAAMVRAMMLARGEIVVFSDANNFYDPDAVGILVRPFFDNSVGATTGAKLIIEDGRDLSSAEGLYWKYESFIKKNESILGSCVSSVGEILAVRKELFVAPREKIINDDHYLVLDLMRRGYRTVYMPEARSLEYVSQTAGDEIERRKRMNAGLYQIIAMSGKLLPFKRPLFLWEIISHKYFRAFVPFAMFFALVSNLVIVLLPTQIKSDSFWALPSPIGQIFLALQLAFYGLAILGNAVPFGGIIGKILYLPTFLVNSNIATAAGLFSFLTNRQAHVWNRVRRTDGS